MLCCVLPRNHTQLETRSSKSVVDGTVVPVAVIVTQCCVCGDRHFALQRTSDSHAITLEQPRSAPIRDTVLRLARKNIDALLRA